MTTIKIHGAGKNEATIIRNDEGQTSFECSKGMWCNRQDDIRWELYVADAIDHAEAHVSQHDQNDLDRLNAQSRMRR